VATRITRRTIDMPNNINAVFRVVESDFICQFITVVVRCLRERFGYPGISVA